ncbi:MAG: hypothetical protein ACHQ06_06725 [Candidatus Dormibacteria bacterium]
MKRTNLACPAAVAGTADTALFLLRRPGLFRSAPGRAVGSVAFLGVWMALATRTAHESDKPTSSTLALSGAAFAGNLATLAVHLRHRVAGPRVFLGTALSCVAFADCVRRVQHGGRRG